MYVNETKTKSITRESWNIYWVRRAFHGIASPHALALHRLNGTLVFRDGEPGYMRETPLGTRYFDYEKYHEKIDQLYEDPTVVALYTVHHNPEERMVRNGEGEWVSA